MSYLKRELNKKIKPEIEFLLREVIRQYKIEEELQRREARFLYAQKLAHLAHWEHDLKNDELYLCDEFYNIYNIDPHTLCSSQHAFKTARNAIHPDDLPYVKNTIKNALIEKKPYSISFRIVTHDGNIRVIHERAVLELDALKNPLKIIGNFQDITDTKRTEDKLKYLAYHVPLTGLPNRILFFDRLNQAKKLGKNNFLFYNPE